MHQTQWGPERPLPLPVSLASTERLHFPFLLSCTGEGNGNLLQCSCLENPRDRGAWWAAVYGVTQSRTRLKQLSSKSSSILMASLYFTYSDFHLSHITKGRRGNSLVLEGDGVRSKRTFSTHANTHLKRLETSNKSFSVSGP